MSVIVLWRTNNSYMYSISEPCCSLNGDMITVKPLSGIVVKTEIPKPIISQDGNHFSANHDQSDYFRDNLESDHWNCEAEDISSALRTSQIRCGFDGCSTNQNKSFEKTSLIVAFYKLARNRRADFSEWTTCPETLGVLSDEGQACLYLSVVLTERTVYEVVMSAYEFLLQGQVSRAYSDMHCMVVGSRLGFAAAIMMKVLRDALGLQAEAYVNVFPTDCYVKDNFLTYGDNTMNERYIVCTNQLTEPSESFIDSSRRLAKMSEETFTAYPNLDGRFMSFGKVLCGMRIQSKDCSNVNTLLALSTHFLHMAAYDSAMFAMNLHRVQGLLFRKQKIKVRTGTSSPSKSEYCNNSTYTFILGSQHARFRPGDVSQYRLIPQSRGRGCRLCGRQQQTEENTVLEEETSIHTDSEYSSDVCEVVVTNSLGSDTEETDHSLDEQVVRSHSLEKFVSLDFYTEPDDNSTDYCALYGRQQQQRRPDAKKQFGRNRDADLLKIRTETVGLVSVQTYN